MEKKTERRDPGRTFFRECVSAGAAGAVRDAEDRLSPGTANADYTLTGAGYDLPERPFPDDLMPGTLNGRRRGWYRRFPDPFLFPGRPVGDDADILMKM